jgi:hypothetical protein
MGRHLLMHGPAGTAGLEFAARFPDPLIADTDGHAALLGLPHLPVSGPDQLHALVERIANGEIRCATLVVENVSSIFDRLSWAIDESDQRFWRERARRWYELVARMRDLPCNVILFAREKTLFAQAGEMVNGRTIGADESVAIGTTADLERTTEYHVEATVRLSVDTFTKLRLAYVTTSYLPTLLAGTVGLADDAFVQTLLGQNAAAPANEAPAVTPPSPAADVLPEPVPAAVPAGAESAPPTAEPQAQTPHDGAQPDPVPAPAPQARDEMLIDEDELRGFLSPTGDERRGGTGNGQVIPFRASGGSGGARRDAARDRANAPPPLGTGPDGMVMNRDLNALFRSLYEAKRAAGVLEEGFPRSISAWIQFKDLPKEPNPEQRASIAKMIRVEIDGLIQPNTAATRRNGTDHRAKYGPPAHLQ